MKLIIEWINLVFTALWLIISITSIVIATVQAFKIERLKTELDIQKNKILLNDSKIRKAYEDFISSFINSSNDKNSWEIEETIKNFTKDTLLFSWESTIHAINKYKTSSPKNKNDKICLTENIFLAMRKDLWVNNSWIKHWDLTQFLVKWDISNILNNKIK